MYEKSCDSSEIAAVLRHMGCSVKQIVYFDTGFKTLLVGFDSANLILQIGGTLDGNDWQGPVYVVHTVQDAIERVNRTRRELLRCSYSVS